MKTSILDQIISDTNNSLSEMLIDLEENPESFNCVTEKSYDEMTSEEREKVYSEISDYLKLNM